MINSFLPTYQRQNLYIEYFVYILVICEARRVRSSVGFKVSSRVRQSSVTSNTLWANLNFFGQIIIQRYFVFVSKVELRTLYIQELPYMNTFCECMLKKIGLTHAHFQYSSRKLVNVVKVRFTMVSSSRKLNNNKVITTACNFCRQIACSFKVYDRTNAPNHAKSRDSKNSVLNFPLFFTWPTLTSQAVFSDNFSDRSTKIKAKT